MNIKLIKIIKQWLTEEHLVILWVNPDYTQISRKRKGISRPKSKSTISKEAYANMKAGFPKKKKKKTKKRKS